MKNNLNILFLTTLIISTFISVSSSNWFGIWMGLELNMLSFIPLISSNLNTLNNEASLKYFLIQAMASIIFIFGAITNSTSATLFNSFNLSHISMIAISLSLLIKLGTPPFHMWFISLMTGLNWINCLILMTWQKIIPLCTMFYLTFNHKLFLTFAIFALLIGSLGGLNQTLLKKIMGFSSINHLGWMISALLYSKPLFSAYFTIYFFMNTMLIFLFNLYHFSSINSLFIHPHSWIFLLNLLSLGGLPPFFGFLPKLLILMNFMQMKNLFMALILTMTALITLFFYLRLIYAFTLLTNFSFKNKILSHLNYSYLMICLNMITIFGLYMWNLL